MRPEMLKMLMTRPQPRAAMPSMKRWVTSNTLERFVLMTSSHAPRSILRKSPSRVTPALLMSTSMDSKSAVTRAHVVSTAPRAPTSNA